MQYLFSCGLGDVKMIYELIDFFEGGAAEGRHVLEITGDDVAAFCDELIIHAKTYMQRWRESLNRDIAKKLKGGQ
jgi:DNA-binding ferritin-like protein (Dps family)